MRHEAEQRAQVKRRLAEEEARRIVDDARRDAEAFLAERIRRIAELSDAVVERGEGIVMRLDRAEEVRRQLQGLADALGESAESLARELGGETPPERRAAPESVAAEAEAAPKAAPGAKPATPKAAAAPEAASPAEAASPEAASPAEAAAGTEASGATASPDAEAEIADDPTVGELAAEAEASEAEPAKAVELVPDSAEEERARREPDEQLSARLVALQMAVAGGKRDEVATHLKRTFELGDVESILDDVFGNGDDDGGGTSSSWPSARDGAA